MSALEQEYLEKFRALDDEKKLQVITFIDEIRQPQMTLAEWIELADKERQALRDKYGEDFRVDIQALLDEVREEPTDERLGRR